MGRARLWAGLSVLALVTACGGKPAPASTPADSLSPQDATAQVLTSLGDPTVRGAELVRHPTDPSCTSPCLRLRVEGAADHGVKEVWLGELILGAVAELVRTHEPTLGAVMAGEVTYRGSNGHPHLVVLASSDSPPGGRFDSPSDSALRERVESVARTYGLGVKSVDVLHPLDSALVVTLTVPAGDVSWTSDHVADELAGSPMDIEGLFVQLESPTGRPLLRIGQRLGGGVGWSAPGQADRFGINHG